MMHNKSSEKLNDCRARFQIFSLVLMVCFSLGSQRIQSQTLERTPGTIQYPTAMTPWDVKMALGFRSIAMPAAIVEETAALHWPLFSFDIVMGLPANFLVEGIVSTEVLTNHFELLGRWVLPITDRLQADAGLGVAYWFGQLKQFEFNNTIHGWFTYPSVRIGYDFGPLAVTAQVQISIVSELTSHSGPLESRNSVNEFNGFSYRISLEQPFWKNTTIGLAFQMNYLKFYYPEWPLFPEFDHYFWIPEAQIWITL